MKEHKTSSYEQTLLSINSAAEMPPEQALETLTACVTKGHVMAATKAVQSLARLNTTGVVPVLIMLYNWAEEDAHKRDRGCSIRTAIVEAAGNIGSPLATEILRKAVRTVQVVKLGPTPEDIAIELRANAALALAKVDPDALYELSLLLFDETPDTPVSPINAPFVKAPVRKAAAQGLGVLGEAGAPLLAIKLKFPGQEVADVLADCIESLIAIRPYYLMEIVEPYLSGEEYLSAITALSLAENLGSEVLELLYETLEKLHGEAKEAIVIAISVVRDGSVKQKLLDFLDDPNPFVRRGAVKGIQAYMDDAIEEKLQDMHINDPDKFVRQDAGEV